MSFIYSTFRNDCNVEVKLRVDKDGNFLEVAALNEIHNHECDEVLYVLYAVIRFSLRIVPKFHFFCPLGKSAVCMEWLIVFT